jgi:hypothetical protein
MGGVSKGERRLPGEAPRAVLSFKSDAPMGGEVGKRITFFVLLTRSKAEAYRLLDSLILGKLKPAVARPPLPFAGTPPKEIVVDNRAVTENDEKVMGSQG